MTLIACGLMVAAALEAAHLLNQAGVLDRHTINPIDEAAIRRAAEETGAIVTVEENLLAGGLGAAVARVMVEQQSACRWLWSACVISRPNQASQKSFWTNTI